MIDINSITDKVKRFFDKESVPPIVQSGETYHVLERYRIVKHDDVYDVYKYDDFVSTLSSSSAALGWCIYDSKNLWSKGNDIIRDDRRIQQYKFDIENRKRILDKTKNDDERQVLLIRINEDANKLKQARRNLNKTVKLTKYIKIKGFNDESE